MRKKWNVVVYRTIISILLLFNTMFFQIINTTVLAAGTAIDAKITQLELTNSGNPATEVEKSATIRMKFDFETPSTMMNKDDYFDIAIPKELDLTTAVTYPLTFDLTDEGGNIVAKATISPTATSATTGGGTVRVTFNENANGKYNFKGHLHFDAKLNKELVHDNDTISIKTKVNNREDLTPNSKSVKINPDKPLSEKEIIGKWGKNPTSRTVAAWAVRINRTNKDLKNVVITDKITSNNGHFLDPSTMPAVKTTEQFKLLKVEYDAAGNVKNWNGEVVDISDKITFNADKTEFRLELGDIGTQAYFLSYKSTVENGDIVQTNSAKITSDTFETQTSDGAWKYHSAGGSADGILAKKLKIRKVDIDTGVGLAGAKFLVTKPDGSTFQLETGTDGTIIYQELIQGKYKVKEITAPNGYDIDENEYTVQVFDDVGGTITVKDKSNKTTVKVKKEWVGPKGGPVTIHLLADDVDTGKTVTLNNGNNWEDTFSNLAKYKADGTAIAYTVKEDAVANYTSSVAGDATNGFTFTNTNNENTSVKVKKEWVGPKGGPVTIHLLADDVDTGKTVTLNNGNNWEDTFSNLAKYKADGTAIAYTVKEDAVANYTSSVTGDATNGFTFTNTNNENTSVKVKKEWVGPKGGPVTIHLLADDVDTGKTVTLNNGNNWEDTFSNLAKYKADGTAIAYTVKEDAVANYTSSVTGDATNGFTVRNTNNENTSVKVKKEWVGPKGGPVTIHLLADDVDTGKTVTLNNGNNWEDTFSNLAKYKADGTAIAYTVKEDAVANYTSSVAGDATNGFTVRNTNNENTSVKVKKEWVGPKGGPVTIHLLADDVDTGKTVTLNNGNNWEDTFSNLAKYKADGTAIAYTVKEDAVANYTSSVAGDATNGFTFTNTNNENTSVKVKKEWVGPKGGPVTIHLLADDVDTGKTVTLNNGNNWEDTFSNLAKYKADGTAIAYTVKEDAVANYTSSVAGDATNGFTVRNTNNENTSVKVKKEWVGPKGGPVTIHLLADDVDTGKTVTLNNGNNWEDTFSNLAKYKADGTAIAYTVKEDAVANYTSSVAGDATNGFTFTNTNNENTSVKVKKEWVGPKGGPVTIHLLADDVDTGKTVTLNNGNNWEDTFSNLAKYKADGTAIAYTVKEDAVANYTSSVTGDATNGFTVTNTNIVHTPRTSDNTNILLFSIVFITSLLFSILIIYNKRKMCK